MLPIHGLLLSTGADIFYMHYPTDRIVHTTAFVTPVLKHWLEQEIAQWVYQEGLIWWHIAPREDTLALNDIPRRIDPSQWTQLQFGLFSVPTSGPQLVYQRPWYVLFCLWKMHIKDPLLLIEKSSLCGGSGFPSKKCVNVTIWMTSNNRW